MTASREGQSVLAALSSKITETKAAKGRTLTPLRDEAPRFAAPLPGTPAAFPNDAPTEVVRGVIAELDRQIAALAGVRDALRLTVGDPVALEADGKQARETEQKLLEREADRKAADQARLREAAELQAQGKTQPRVNAKAARIAALTEGGELPTEEFNARLARLTEEAQASAFQKEPSSTTSETPAPSGTAAGWRCPQHPDAEPKDDVSARRRLVFHRCSVGGCREFEKL